MHAWVDAGVWSVSPAWTTGATSSAVSAKPTSASSIAAPKTTPSTVPSALSSGPPTRLKVVPYFNFAPIENAVARVKASAKAYDAALAAGALRDARFVRPHR